MVEAFKNKTDSIKDDNKPFILDFTVQRVF